MQLMYLVDWLSAVPLEELTTRTESAFPKKVIKMLHQSFVHVGKTLTDIQIVAVAMRGPSADIRGLTDHS